MKRFTKSDNGLRMIERTSYEKYIKFALTTKYFYIGKWGFGITYPTNIKLRL